jgi:hypothetical protein
MASRRRARRRTPARRRRRAAGLLVAVAATAAALDRQAASPSTATAPSAVLRVKQDGGALPPREPRGPLGQADGALPDGATAFDELPGVANLDPALLTALRRAATSAAHAGVELLVDSGWRSPDYQQRLLRQAISEHGSAEEAARWVAAPATSRHVSGDAVDVGPSAAAAWLSRNGAAYGLCQVYANEPWHFELRPDAAGHGCPPTYPDPTHDPRMQP